MVECIETHSAIYFKFSSQSTARSLAHWAYLPILKRLKSKNMNVFDCQFIIHANRSIKTFWATYHQNDIVKSPPKKYSNSGKLIISLKNTPYCLHTAQMNHPHV